MILRKDRPKGRKAIFHHILRSYSTSIALGSTILVLATVILSTFYNYRITILTNEINECNLEIILLTTGIIIFVYEHLLTSKKFKEPVVSSLKKGGKK